MKLQQLIEQINAYGTARATGNPLLIQFSTEILQQSLKNLAEDLPLKEENTPQVVQSNN